MGLEPTTSGAGNRYATIAPLGCFFEILNLPSVLYTLVRENSRDSMSALKKGSHLMNSP